VNVNSTKPYGNMDVQQECFGVRSNKLAAEGICCQPVAGSNMGRVCAVPTTLDLSPHFCSRPRVTHWCVFQHLPVSEVPCRRCHAVSAGGTAGVIKHRQDGADATTHCSTAICTPP
jgi:hypothetical protein